MFDTRIAYVAESGPADERVKRIAVMDSDGNNQSFVTAGDTIVLTPRLSPKAESSPIVSYVGGQPNIRIVDLASGEQRPLVPGSAMSFAPRFSPDGRRIAFSMQAGANTDIYVAESSGGPAQRLTTAPGIDTDPSFSPDGSQDRFRKRPLGHAAALHHGRRRHGQRRISFGGGWYAAPDVEPRRRMDRLHPPDSGRPSRIGVMEADGSGEKLLTDGALDEGPELGGEQPRTHFPARRTPTGAPALYRVTLAGGEARKVVTPQDASDPDWSGVLD